jgi:preprotein translocase subunit SecG
MVWVNSNTIIVAAFFVVTVILCGVTNARKAKADRYATEEAEVVIA